jgi:hypothetical protein
MTSREKTTEEVRTEFLQHIRGAVNYWANLKGEHTIEDRCEGVAFSILVAIDGCSSGLPAFILAPIPHESDKQFSIDNNENYFPENHESNVKCDIGTLGELHHKFLDKEEDF